MGRPSTHDYTAIRMVAERYVDAISASIRSVD